MSRRLKHPSKERLRALFEYHPDGYLIWKSKTHLRSRSIGTPIKPRSGINKYTQVQIDKGHYRLHNLIWIYHNGDIPSDLTVDHRDRDKTNNKIDNLRLASARLQEINKLSRGFSRSRKNWRTTSTLFKSVTYETALQARLRYEQEMLAIDSNYQLAHFTEAIKRLMAGDNPQLKPSAD